jgi:hypothetical protein
MHPSNDISITKLTNNGDKTNHQLQSINPVSLSVMNISVSRFENVPPNDTVVLFAMIKCAFTYLLFYTLTYRNSSQFHHSYPSISL